MARQLTYNEKNKINQICKSEMTLVTAYGNFAKIIAPIFTISFSYFCIMRYHWVLFGFILE